MEGRYQVEMPGDVLPGTLMSPFSSHIWSSEKQAERQTDTERQGERGRGEEEEERGALWNTSSLEHFKTLTYMVEVNAIKFIGKNLSFLGNKTSCHFTFLFIKISECFW